MGSGAILSHSQIMPETPPLRQVPPGSAPKGSHSSPGLKTWGFLAGFINRFGYESSVRGVVRKHLFFRFVRVFDAEMGEKR